MLNNNLFCGDRVLMFAISGGYSNSGARGKDFRKLMFSEKEKEL